MASVPCLVLPSVESRDSVRVHSSGGFLIFTFSFCLARLRVFHSEINSLLSVPERRLSALSAIGRDGVKNPQKFEHGEGQQGLWLSGCILCFPDSGRGASYLFRFFLTLFSLIVLHVLSVSYLLNRTRFLYVLAVQANSCNLYFSFFPCLKLLLTRALMGRNDTCMRMFAWKAFSCSFQVRVVSRKGIACSRKRPENAAS